MNKRRLKGGAFAAVAALIVIAIAVVVNMIMGAVPTQYTKYDTTGLGLYDLTEETEALIKAIDQDVTLYLVARDGREDTVIREFLNRYAMLNDRITVKTVDPEIAPSMSTDNGTSHAVSNMMENSVIVSSAARDYEVSYDTIYTTDYTEEEMMMYYYYGQTPTGTTSFTGEQAITSAIDNVTTDDLPKLYTLTGHNEASFGEAMTSYLKTDNFETAELSLITGDGAVPDDADCVIINNPTADISTKELDSLKSYVDGGGKLILVTSYDTLGTEYPNIKALGEYYGLLLKEGLVMEANTANYSQYPYYLVPNLSTTDPITAELTGGYTMMPLAQGLTVSEQLREGVSVSKLLTTSEDAYTAIIKGESIDVENPIYSGECTIGAIATVTGEGTEGKFVWYTSYGVTDDSIDSYVSGGNSKLFLATLGELCEKKASVSIAGKAMTTESLVVSQGAGKLWTVSFVIIIPLAVIVSGVSIWAVRRKK